MRRHYLPESSQHLNLVESIFWEVCNADPVNRNTIIQERCDELADQPRRSELQRHVERLLAADASSSGFLDTGKLGFEFMEIVTREPTSGDHIGPFELVREIGRGGMGIVFEAIENNSVGQRVALKLPRVGINNRTALARFNAERLTLARLNHPNLTRYFQAGMTDQGLPYFTMELVVGTSITTFCSQNELEIADRLFLFTHVCNAIEHAHQKGIIHRDIKPQNVMVTLGSDRPVPKIIDFGIAKHIEISDQMNGNEIVSSTVSSTQMAGDPTNVSDHSSPETRSDNYIGTPHYMSPEQLNESANSLDCRSDIFSLGVLLHELVTGSPKQTKPNTISETRPHGQSKISQPQVHPKLKLIMNKALATKRENRFSSAAEFRQCILNYLAEHQSS